MHAPNQRLPVEIPKPLHRLFPESQPALIDIERLADLDSHIELQWHPPSFKRGELLPADSHLRGKSRLRKA